MSSPQMLKIVQPFSEDARPDSGRRAVRPKTGRATELERAFELARTGAFPALEHIRKRLKAEGYPVGQIVGPTLLRQLRAICQAARSQPRMAE
jgi:hypothetical protein